MPLQIFVAASFIYYYFALWLFSYSATRHCKPWAVIIFNTNNIN